MGLESKRNKNATNVSGKLVDGSNDALKCLNNPKRKMNGKILAIDPGNEESAFVVWDGHRILEKGKWSNQELLDNLPRIVQNINRGNVYIEMVASYGMAVGKTVFETCVWIGRYEESIVSLGCEVKKVYRKDVKMHICQSMRAKDSNIRQAIIDRFGKPGTKSNPNLVYQDREVKMAKDIWAAFAVALTATEGDKIG